MQDLQFRGDLPDWVDSGLGTAWGYDFWGSIASTWGLVRYWSTRLLIPAERDWNSAVSCLLDSCMWWRFCEILRTVYWPNCDALRKTRKKGRFSTLSLSLECFTHFWAQYLIEDRSSYRWTLVMVSGIRCYIQYPIYRILDVTSGII